MALVTLSRCGDIQRELFFKNFMTHQRPGEITCVNDEEWGDTFLFEHWRIRNIDFVACFRLLSEDSALAMGKELMYHSHHRILEEKTERQRELYQEFLKKLESQGKTIAQVKKEMQDRGEDASLIDFKEYTREMLEERLPPGKKTIQGDRYTTIEVLSRQEEIPHDLQRARLNQYFLNAPQEILDLMDLPEAELEDWKKDHLISTSAIIGLSTKMPLLSHVVQILPKIYSFPDKELNVE